MKPNHARYTNIHNRQTRKPRRRLLFAGLFSVILLLFGGYIVTYFEKDALIPTTETAAQQATFTKDIRLAWPTVGQAAVGSVEGGLLARSSNKEELRPTASMAKVITALAIMKKQPFKLGQAGKSYTLTSKDVANYRAHAAKNGSVLPVYEGMALTQYQAMQMMLIASANNISDTLVEKVFGSEEVYRSYAQDMLQNMGVSQTVIADASGLNPATVSTPSELVTIGIAALKNPVITEIVAQPHAQIPGVGIIKNTNELVSTDGAVGIKTGTTDEAGSCLLFAARYVKDGQKVTIVGVIMGDADPVSLFGDSRNLLASTKQGFGLVDAQPAGAVVTPLPVRGGRAPN